MKKFLVDLALVAVGLLLILKVVGIVLLLTMDSDGASERSVGKQAIYAVALGALLGWLWRSRPTSATDEEPTE